MTEKMLKETVNRNKRVMEQNLLRSLLGTFRLNYFEFGPVVQEKMSFKGMKGYMAIL